jgi:cytochrome c
MNTMEVTKLVGAFCGSLLVFLLIQLVAHGIFSTESGATAYQIEVAEEEGGGEAAAEEQVDVAALVAAADPADGESVFKKCASCHKLDGSNGVGPHLDGVVGRDAGTVEGFSYSSAMVEHGPWTPEALFAFLADPKSVIEGTKMSFAGLKKEQDRADVIAYLQSLSQ